MNEMQASQPERVAAGPLRFRRGDPLRRWTVIVLAVCVLLFGWSLVADRLTPYTSDASVRAFVVRIVPEVSGKVVEVSVHDNQIVRGGDLLYRIDPTPFGIAVERAEAKLAAAGQAVGASTAAVDEAQAQLVQELDLGAAPAQCRCDPVNEIRRRLRIGDGLGRRAPRLSLALAQCGEFGFVLFGAAQAGGLMSAERVALASVLITISMLATPFLVRLGDRLLPRE